MTMNWDTFIIYAISAIICLIIGPLLVFCKRNKSGLIFSAIGSLILYVFTIGMWIYLERPPLRTMGETRLWYSLFLSTIGIVIYARYRYNWLLGFSSTLSIVFICINLLNPEIHSKTLMPALQSIWFVPHVVSYMFSYAMLGAATLFAIYLWFWKQPQETSDNDLHRLDKLVKCGWYFLTTGMVIGALWAKEAWGDFWSWDPKETWAFTSWLCYLIYIHISRTKTHRDVLFFMLIISFVILQMCWWGINYLPSAQGYSIHTY